MLSQKAKYALRALFVLAEEGTSGALTVGEISERQKLPPKFLERILLDLKNRGILRSRRGKGGGYALLKPPSEIFFGEVVRIMDGPMAPLPCLSRTAYRRCDDCPDEGACPMRRVFSVMHKATLDVLDGTSLADALAGRAPELVVTMHEAA
ncbi:RrF2 family transcriptional regulator [Marinivivus vitaminiproducens]|uniref:RrF2 family transcriptional regulator n=1 Tax=Marinivivus vitaminiproducens TaxID=3035935 RepID=UPI0027A16482|nr:Rrf2 family transcriptional regulator [Geminicoccaceae bacterium SCSIO 64248]